MFHEKYGHRIINWTHTKAHICILERNTWLHIPLLTHNPIRYIRQISLWCPAYSPGFAHPMHMSLTHSPSTFGLSVVSLCLELSAQMLWQRRQMWIHTRLCQVWSQGVSVRHTSNSRLLATDDQLAAQSCQCVCVIGVWNMMRHKYMSESRNWVYIQQNSLNETHGAKHMCLRDTCKLYSSHADAQSQMHDMMTITRARAPYMHRCTCV